MKTIRAKKINYQSYLGDAQFEHVPVLVEDGVKAKDFDPEKDDYSLSGDIISLLEREIAKGWLGRFLKRDTDNNMTSRGVIKADEVYGIMLVLGLKQIEFAKLLGVDKSTITRVIKGTKNLGEPSTRLCTLVLQAELREPGAAKKLFKNQILDDMTVVPHYDFKEAKLA